MDAGSGFGGRRSIVRVAVATAGAALFLLMASSAARAVDDPADPYDYAPPPVITVVLSAPDEVTPPPPAPPQVPVADTPPATILRDALPTLSEVLHDAHGLAMGGATALLWIALVALPGSLLEASIEKRAGRRMGRALATVSGLLNRAVDGITSRSNWPLTGPLVVALAAATAFGFADPHLAWDARSLSTVAALFVALTLITVGASQIGAVIVRRAWGIHASVKAEPLGLLAAVGGVAVGRFLSLSPGLFLGLVVGVEAGHNPTPAQKGRAVIARIAVVFTFAVGGWLLYSSWFGGHGTPEGGLPGFASDVLSAVTVEGMMYLVTALLPIAPLPGRDLFVHSKKIWTGAYAVVAFAFAVVALPTVLGHAEHGGIGTLTRQAAVMVLFAAVSVGSWLHARRTGAVPAELERV